MAERSPLPHQEKRIAEFLDAGTTFSAALVPFVSIIALKGDESDIIVSGRLTFASPTALLETKNFESASIRAVASRLGTVEDAQNFLRDVAAGSANLAGRRYLFPAQPGSQISVDVEPFHQGPIAQSRFCVLKMGGTTLQGMVSIHHTDWELKATEPPYINLQELALEYGAPVPANQATFEALYAVPIIVDGERSRLNGQHAEISVKVERGIDQKDVSIGVVAIKTGESAFRHIASGTDLTWTDDGKFSIGTANCDVPPGRAVQAIARIRDVAFQYWWVIDPQHVMNPRKAVYEVVDPGLSRLNDLLGQAPKGAARDFESAVAWLLWLLGFSVAHLGSNRLTQDAVDILASTPGGHFALVECTTGVISTDKKVPNLLRRRALVVEKLKQSNHNVAHVLPVLVTSCGRDEVEQEIEPAEQRGVLVLARDDLLAMLDQTQFVGNADTLYSEVEERLAGAARAAQPGIPGI